MKDKRDLSLFYVAIGAVSFFVAIIPILDSFSTFICNFFGLQSIKLNNEANKLQEGQEPQVTHAIGFQIPSDEENYEGDE